MIDIVVVCVYDRARNLRHWFRCWELAKPNAKLVVISGYERGHKVPEYATYIQRPNKGMDIGKFQDVVLGRVPEFPQWETLLWVNDDCFPTQLDFLTPFNEALNDDTVGVACMCISPFGIEHIRTTGYAIRRAVAEKLRWPVDPIQTRQDCLNYEHKDPDNHLLQQVRDMGYKAVQVAPNENSPMYDFGYPRRARALEKKHIEVFGRP